MRETLMIDCEAGCPFGFSNPSTTLLRPDFHVRVRVMSLWVDHPRQYHPAMHH